MLLTFQPFCSRWSFFSFIIFSFSFCFLVSPWQTHFLVRRTTYLEIERERKQVPYFDFFCCLKILKVSFENCLRFTSSRLVPYIQQPKQYMTHRYILRERDCVVVDLTVMFTMYNLLSAAFLKSPDNSCKMSHGDELIRALASSF